MIQMNRNRPRGDVSVTRPIQAFISSTRLDFQGHREDKMRKACEK